MDKLYAITEEEKEYDLTMSSTAGGSVTAPGEGTFTYIEGTEVNLVAEAEEGYRFVNWTGDGHHCRRRGCYYHHHHAGQLLHHR
jgi:hypothetical protein